MLYVHKGRREVVGLWPLRPFHVSYFEYLSKTIARGREHDIPLLT